MSKEDKKDKEPFWKDIVVASFMLFLLIVIMVLVIVAQYQKDIEVMESRGANSTLDYR